MSNLLHTVGGYPLFLGLLSQFVVLAQAIKSREKPAIVQAALLILALSFASAALMLRPHSPPQFTPDLLGCFAAVFLLTPAVEAVRKMLAKKSEGDKKR